MSLFLFIQSNDIRASNQNIKIFSRQTNQLLEVRRPVGQSLSIFSTIPTFQPPRNPSNDSSMKLNSWSVPVSAQQAGQLLSPSTTSSPPLIFSPDSGQSSSPSFLLAPRDPIVQISTGQPLKNSPTSKHVSENPYDSATACLHETLVELIKTSSTLNLSTWLPTNQNRGPSHRTHQSVCQFLLSIIMNTSSKILMRLYLSDGWERERLQRNISWRSAKDQECVWVCNLLGLSCRLCWELCFDGMK